MTNEEKIIFTVMRPVRAWTPKELSQATGLDAKTTRGTIRRLIGYGLVDIVDYDHYGRFKRVKSRQYELFAS